MLHALELENFKAFGERTCIPFAPITLIFGENSAGKSTILQALNLLKQTLESRETGALLLPRTENGIVDLGSFQEMLFDHDLKRTLSIRVETKLNRELAIEFNFKRPSLEAEVLLDQIQIYDGKPSKCIARFQPSGTTVDPRDLWMMMGSFRDRRGLSPAKLAAVKCVWLTKATEYWKPEFEWCQKNKDKILSWISEEKSDLAEHLKHQTDMEDSSEQEDSNEEFQKRLNSLSEDFKFFSSDFDLKTYISKRRKEKMNTILGVQGFLLVGIISRERYSWIAGTPPHY